jgi:hypothetical protein
MPEIEIKRTNFFDGQFLKQGEFLDLDVYHVHMRRRWAFVMFNQSGVVQAGASDFMIEVPNTAVKSLRVRAGMAIGKNTDVIEAKEIVLRQDTPLIDLTTISPNVPAGLSAGDIGVVTVHYEEEPVPIPASEGDVAGNTRVREHARITVHRNAMPAANAPNGEPFVRLGDVVFNTMVVNPASRQTAFLNAALLAATPQISLSPNSVPGTGTVAITVTSSGGLNLSTANNANVQITPNTGIAHNVTGQTATSMTLTLTLTGAPPGSVTITVNTNTSASATLTVQPGLSLSGFGTVNEPLGDTLFEINGTGFGGATLVEFTRNGGGFTTPLSLSPGNVTPTQLTVPLAMIPTDADIGPVRVQSGSQTVTSAGNATPPAIITGVAFLDAALNPVPGTLGNVGQLLQITGQRFVNITDIGVANALRSSSAPPFPTAPNESVLLTQIRVRVVPAASTQTGSIRVINAGGTVQSAVTVSIA